MSQKEVKPEETARKRAVALKYSPEQMTAPTIVAKGKGSIAEAILARAQEAGVPIQEDAALVEVLSKLDLDQQIPGELYGLVAELLAFVYRSDRAAGKRSGR